MLSKKVKIALISVGGALVVGGGLGVGLGIGLNQGNKDNPNPPAPVYDGDPCPPGECIDANFDGICDNCGYPVEMEHSTSISGDPSAPFYLKVGQEKDIKATLNPTPDRDEEKTFTWKVSNKNVANFTSQDVKQNKNRVVGVTPGKVTFTATNDYDNSKKRDFNATVINFDEDNMYLWEYNKDDRAKFGYVNEQGMKAGISDGVATLGNINWKFHRSETTSLQSNKGALGFGKGSAPETYIKLSSTNTRQIKSIVIETASAKAMANITVKIGDNEVINKKTPNYADDFIGSVSYSDNIENPSKLSGDISIEFDTPAYNAAEAEAHPDTYQAPGAVYLKSILIEYYEIELDWKTNVTYDMKAEYLKSEAAEFKDGYFNGLTGTAKPLTINDEENGITINFEKIKKYSSSDNVKLADHALTNGYIDIILNKPDEVIKQVKFEYINGTNNTTYTSYTSIFGGEPFINIQESNNTGYLGKLILEDNVNAMRFVPKGNNVAVHSITVKTIAGEQLEIDSFALKEGAEATKKSYKEGEIFSTEGLGNIVVSFINEGANPVEIPADAIKWYDGVSYDSTPGHENASEILKAGTTYVVGVYKDYTLKYEGIDVKLFLMNFELIKNLDQIEANGKYLMVSKENKAFLKGSSGADMDTGKGIVTSTDFAFDDTFSIGDVYENDLITFEKDSSTDKYYFMSSTGHMWGVNANTHSISLTTKKLAEDKGCQLWTITINSETGAASFIMNFEDTAQYFGYKKNSFSISESSLSSVYIYKLINIAPAEPTSGE